MPETGQRINDTQENDQKTINLRSERKRILVADELEQHPVFKTLKVSAAENNIGIMLDAIVDRYFEFSSDGNNNLQNQEYYVVSPTLIEMALAQTIYLINKTENGVVLDADGTQNERLSNEQKMMASSTEMKEYYRKLLDEGEKEKDTSAVLEALDESKKVSETLVLLSNMTTREEIKAYWESDEGQKVKKEVLSGKETKKDIITSRVGSNLEKAEDVEIMRLCKEIYFFSTSTKINQDTKINIMENLKQLEAYLGDRGAMLESDKVKGKVDIKKVLEHYVQYSKEYAKKENLKSIEGIGELGQKGRNWNNLSVEEKRDALEAMYTLYTQEGGKYREKAILAMSSIDGLTKVSKTGWASKDITIDEAGFIGIWNSVNEGKNITNMATLATLFTKNQRNAVYEHLYMLEQMVKAGTFEERTDEQAKNHNGTKKYNENSRNDSQSNIEKPKQEVVKNEQNVVEDEQEVTEKQETTKGKLLTKINRRLRENYRKAKMYKVSENVDNLFKGISVDDEEKFFLMITAYAALLNPKGRLNKQLTDLQEDSKIPPKVTKNIGELLQLRIIENVPPPDKMSEINEQISQSRYFERTGDQYIDTKVHNFINCYQILQQTDIKVTQKFMEEYMLKNPKLFGKVISPDENGVQKIDRGKLYGFMGQAGNKEKVEKMDNLAMKGIDGGTMISLFSEVAMHKRTPGYLLRGSIEAAKDALDAVSRRVSRIMYKPRGRKALPTGRGDTVKEDYNVSVIDTIGEEYLTNRSADAIRKGKEDIKLDIPEHNEPTPPVSEFDQRLKYELEDSRKDVIVPAKQAYEVELRKKFEEILSKEGLSKEDMSRMSTAKLGETVKQFGGEEVLKEAKEQYQELESKTVVTTQTKNGTNYGDDSEEQGMEI